MEGLQNLVALLIPISAIVLGIGVAFWSIYWDHQKKRLQYQERQLMIEKGLTPPPMLPEKSRKTPEDSLRRGIVLLFLGIGFAVGAVVLANFRRGPRSRLDRRGDGRDRRLPRSREPRVLLHRATKTGGHCPNAGRLQHLLSTSHF